ncbi:MAG: hypothetical protein AAF417_15030 [Pseudomonadota bacterium]
MPYIDNAINSLEGFGNNNLGNVTVHDLTLKITADMAANDLVKLVEVPAGVEILEIRPMTVSGTGGLTYDLGYHESFINSGRPREPGSNLFGDLDGFIAGGTMPGPTGAVVNALPRPLKMQNRVGRGYHFDIAVTLTGALVVDDCYSWYVYARAEGSAGFDKQGTVAAPTIPETTFSRT